MSDPILDLVMQDNDGDAETIRDYLCNLLITLWRDGEGFSGKRPFGNSGWEYELYAPLIKAGMVRGTVDEFGSVDEIGSGEVKTADQLIFMAIERMCAP